MSIQLIVFPQYYDGTTPFAPSGNQMFVDGINFNNVNTSTSALSVATPLPQNFIDTYTVSGISTFTMNTWYRFSANTGHLTFSKIGAGSCLIKYCIQGLEI